MSIIVEDGTGLSTANSYVSLADANTYHSDRGNSAWALGSEANRNAALIRATAALDARYSGRWPGVRYSEAQALDWPRSYAWDRDGYPLTELPAAVVNAACEAALIELDSAGALSKKAETGLKRVAVEGAVSKEWTGASSAGAIAYPAISQALARIVKGGAGQVDIGGR